MHTVGGRRGVVILAAAAALMSGCSQPLNSTGAPVGSPSGVSDPSMVDLELNHILPSAAQILTIEARELSAENQCYREAGLLSGATFSDPSAVPRYVNFVIQARVTYSPVWGFFDPRAATTLGYQADGSIGGFSEDPPAGADKGLVERCESSARAAVGGHHWAELLFPQSLPDGGPPVALAGEAVSEANRAWSDCMKAHGQHFDTPVHALGQWAKETTPSAAQIAAASADVQCKVATNLVGIDAAAQNEAVRAYVAAHEAAVEAYRNTVAGAAS